MHLKEEPNAGQMRLWESEHHSIAGNRVRMIRRQEIKEDQAYLEELSVIEWSRGTAIARRTEARFAPAPWAVRRRVRGAAYEYASPGKARCR